MRRRQLDLGRHRRASCPARTSPVSARAPSARPKRIEQDRLARAGLAGEHAEARLELELEPLDQHDIVDGELPQHGEERSRQASLRADGGPPPRVLLLLRRAASATAGTSRFRDNCVPSTAAALRASSGMPSAR